MSYVEGFFSLNRFFHSQSMSTTISIPPLGTKKRLLEVQGDVMEITPLGAGQEVGRSCVLMKFRGKQVMFDCGIHPAFTGVASLPFFDHIQDMSAIDLCLVTHFHLDHSGAVPYLIGRTNFKGRIFMTHPTKPICKLLWQDFSRVSRIAADEHIYSRADIDQAMTVIERSTFHETVTLPCGISFTAYRAGHVLGAAMYVVEIAGVRVLYTGDFSCEIDRHLPAAEIVPAPIHALIVESTYGVQSHEPREERERRFTQSVHEIVQQGGKCLLPVFALGRAQELVLLLEEYWQRNPDLQKVPIYYCTPMANKCLRIFETYTALCSERVQEEANNCHNTWRSLRFVKNLADSAGPEWDNRVMAYNQPCVVLAAPGMLQSGTSRELFEHWCSDRRNGVIMTGYSVGGTLANDLQSDPELITLPDGRRLPLKCVTRFISFSAHSDYGQTREFIAATQTPHVILVHGEQNLMRRLRDRLAVEFPHISCSNPQNTQTVELQFPSGSLLGEAVGEAGSILENKDKMLDKNDSTTLLLVEDPNSHGLSANSGISGIGGIVVTPSDMNQFVGVSAIKAKFTQRIDGLPIPADESSIDFVRRIIGDLFDEIEIVRNRILVNDGQVEVQSVGTTAWITWMASPSSDMVADSVCLLLLNARNGEVDSSINQMTKTADVDGTRMSQIISKLTEINYGDITETDGGEWIRATAFDGQSEIQVCTKTGEVVVTKGDAASGLALAKIIQSSLSLVDA
jgi:cleavage and polyadenylation specificity factor subunit 3